MNGVFTKLYSNSRAGVLNSVRGAYTSPLSTALGSINRFKTYLESESSKTTNLVTGLVLDPNVVCDQLTDGHRIDRTKDHFGTIEDSVAQATLEAWTQVSDPQGNITLTDVNGSVYHIHTVLSPEPMAQAVVHASTDAHLHDYLNFIIASLGMATQETILDCLQLLLEYEGYDDPSQYTQIEEAAQLLSGQQLGTISQHVIYYGSHLPTPIYPVYGTDSRLIWKEDGTWYVNNVILDILGVPHSLFDVLQSQIVSGEVNSCLLQFSRFVSAGVQNIEAYATLATDFTKSKFEAVRSTARRLKMAFATGGIYGLCKSILAFAQSARETMVNEDGSLCFTDNSRFTPKEYLAGLVARITEVASQLVTYLFTIFGRILGVIGAVLGFVVSSLVQAISFDFEGTKGSLIDGDNVLSSTPYGLFQATVQQGQMPQALLDAFDLGYPLVIVDVVGGQLVFGHGPDNNLGHTYRCEFHPSFDDYSDVWAACDDFISYDSVQGYAVKVNLDAEYDIKFRAAAINAISDDSITTYDNDPNTGYLSDTDDEKIRRNIVCNMALFLLYYGSDSSHSSASPSVWIDLQVDGRDIYLDMSPDWAKNQGIYHRFDFDYSHEGPSAYAWVLAFCWFMHKYWAYQLGDIIQEPIQQGSYRRGFLHPFSYATITKLAVLWTTYNQALMAGVPGGPYIIEAGDYFGNFLELSNTCRFSLQVPQYNRETFWKWFALTTLVTGAVVGATIGMTVALTNKVRYMQAKAAAKVYEANEKMQKEPTKENYTLYRRAVKKNNFLCNITGGTTYSKVNVWEGGSDVQTSASAIGSTIVDSLLSADVLDYASLNDNTIEVPSVDPALQRIYAVITGKSLLDEI